MKNATTGVKILVYLQDHPGASAAEISRFLDLTPADVRYHLSGLLQQGEIETAPAVPLPVAGRPAKRYTIAAKKLPENTSRLAAAALSVLLSDGRSADPSSPLYRIALQLTQEYQPPAQTSQRVRSAVSYLNTHGYKVSWEAHAQGPRIRFSACPYLSLITSIPQLCELDTLILQILLGSPFVLTRHSGRCLFTLAA